MVGYAVAAGRAGAAPRARAASCSASASRPTSRPAVSRRRRWSARSARRPGCGRARKVRVHPTGKVTVFTGASAARTGPRDRPSRRSSPTKLGIDIDKVDVVHGDTEQVQFGMGTYGSRSAAVGGSAIAASASTRSSTRASASPPTCSKPSHEDIEFEDGKFARRGRAGAQTRRGATSVLQAYLAHNLPRRRRAGSRSDDASTIRRTSRSRSAPTSRSSRSTPTPARSSSCATWRSTTSATSSTR